MEPFLRFEAPAAPLPEPNVDTDRIIPARFLRKPRSAGYGNFLFYDERFDREGKPRLGFVLNQPFYREARILLAGENFGCGSSREGAVFALLDWGFRSVVAVSFGEIFYRNCLKNGVLPVRLRPGELATLLAAVERSPGLSVCLDLEQQVVGCGRLTFSFDIDPFSRECLLRGLDDVELTLEHRSELESFEARQREAAPWLFGEMARDA